MGHEINTDSIRDLEKQIKEGAGDVIQLKRTRNSLLNISSRVPPEILGSIFRWNVIPGGAPPYFVGLQKGSYNFLLVCHHWFEVASHTPELWSFWGVTLEQWSRRYKRSSGAVPLDLVLNRCYVDGSDISFDGPIREALQDRAARDTIRSVHLLSETPLLTSILSSLTPDGEDVRRSSIESIGLRAVDVSDFFARSSFPQLWYLDFAEGTKISSWEHFGLHTTALTALSLKIGDTSPTPTTSQLLSILTSNPRLRSLTLSESMIPQDKSNGSTSRVPLHHLRDLSLAGDFHHVFRLLRRLDHPETMDGTLGLTLSRCTVGDILEILGPYVRDYLQRDKRSRDQLGVGIDSSGNSVSIRANTINTLKCPTQREIFATFTAELSEQLPPPAMDRLCIDLAAYTPGERVIYFGWDSCVDAVREILPAMPNIQELYLTSPLLSNGFLQPESEGPLANTKLLPSLRWLHLEDTFLEEGDWSPLLSYLVHQTSGGQVISLSLYEGYVHVCKNVACDIQSLVENFIIHSDLDEYCPSGVCPWIDEEGEE
jgi:hypothetical protein